MAGINKVILVGNLGRDPELRHTNSGDAVCSLSIGTSRSWTDKQTNERVSETEWHRVTVWRKQAESCDTYLRKGSQVYIEGRLKTTKYQGKDGNDRYSTDIVADTVQFLGGRSDGQSQDNKSNEQPNSQQGGSRHGGNDSQNDDMEDDVPF